MHSLNHHLKRILLLPAALLFLLPASALAEEAETVPVPAERTATEQEMQYLSDGDLASRIRIAAGSTLVWELPEGTEALRLLWHDAPKQTSVYAVDAAGQPFDDVYDAAGTLETVMTLAEDAAEVTVRATGESKLVKLSDLGL